MIVFSSSQKNTVFEWFLSCRKHPSPSLWCQIAFKRPKSSFNGVLRREQRSIQSIALCEKTRGALGWGTSHMPHTGWVTHTHTHLHTHLHTYTHSLSLSPSLIFKRFFSGFVIPNRIIQSAERQIREKTFVEMKFFGLKN